MCSSPCLFNHHDGYVFWNCPKTENPIPRVSNRSNLLFAREPMITARVRPKTMENWHGQSVDLKIEKKIQATPHILHIPPSFSLPKMEASSFLGPVLAITPGKTMHLCYYETKFSGMKFCPGSCDMKSSSCRIHHRHVMLNRYPIR